MSALARVGQKLTDFITGSQSQVLPSSSQNTRSPQQVPDQSLQTEVVDDDLDDLDPARYTSRGRNPSSFRKVEPKSLESKRRAFHNNKVIADEREFGAGTVLQGGMRDKRSIRESLLLPSGSQSRSTSGTPIAIPSSAPPPSRRKPPQGGPRPRNDFGKWQSQAREVGRIDNGTSAVHPEQPGAKRRRLNDEEPRMVKPVEGDGYEYSDRRPATHEKAEISPVKSQRSPPREEPNLHKIRKDHFTRTRQQENEENGQIRLLSEAKAIEDVIDDDVPVVMIEKPKPRSSRLSFDAPNRPVKRRRQESPNMSPDELSQEQASAGGPEKDYEEVQYVRNQGPLVQGRAQRKPQKNLAGFPMKHVKWGPQEFDGDQVRLESSIAGVYRLVVDGNEASLVLRVKNVLYGLYHMNCLIVILKIVPTDKSQVQIALVFRNRKDQHAFLLYVLSNVPTPESFQETKSARQMQAIYDQGLDIGPRIQGLRNVELASKRKVLPAVTPAVERIAKQPIPHSKLKDRLTKDDDASARYDPAVEGAANGDQELQAADDALRRSNRVKRQVQTTSDGSFTRTERIVKIRTPSPPPLDRYSVKVGLGKRWKVPLVYPSTGKNRATVSHDDLIKLDEGELLNDNLINFYLRYLEETLKEQKPEVAKRVYWFNTYFFASIVKDRRSAREINYDAVKKWTRAVDLFSYDYILVPIVENFHWYLAIICNVSSLHQNTVNVSNGLDSETADFEADAKPQSVAIDTHADEQEPRGVEIGSELHAKEKYPSFSPRDRSSGTPRSRTSSEATPVQQSRASSVPRKASELNEDVHQSQRSIDEIFESLKDLENSRESTATPASRPPSSRSYQQVEKPADLMTDLLQHLNGPIPSQKMRSEGEEEPEIAATEQVDISRLDVSENADVQFEAKREPRGATNTVSQDTSSAKKKQKSKVAPIRRFGENMPAIITLDSLGQTHFATIRVLKQYLVAEAHDKRDGWELDAKGIQGLTGIGIPEQTNFCDCGLYLLGYAEKFIKDPKTLVSKLLQKSLDASNDWPELDASSMRHTLRDLLCKEHAEYDEGRKAGKITRTVAKQRNNSHSLLQSTTEQRELSEPTIPGTSNKSEVSNSRDMDNRTAGDLIEPQISTNSRQDGDHNDEFQEHRPKTRGEALKTAQPLDDDARRQRTRSSEREVTLPSRRRKNAHDPPAADDDTFEIIHSIPSDTAEVSVEIPRRSELRSMVPETPQSSPPPTEIISSKFFSDGGRPAAPSSSPQSAKSKRRGNKASGSRKGSSPLKKIRDMASSVVDPKRDVILLDDD